VIGRLPLAYVLDTWRPGSFDRTWQDEFTDLGSQRRIGEMLLRTYDPDGNPHDELCLRMLRGEPVEPVTLGWDSGWWGGRWWQGRVWAGHHRLWLWHTVGWDLVPVDVVPRGERRPWPGNHCAPTEGRIDEVTA
jgi:hypothetical protein